LHTVCCHSACKGVCPLIDQQSPGESDAEFAARLASAISVGGGTDQEAALGARAGLTGGAANASRVSSAPGGIARARPLPDTQQGTPSATSTPLGASANLAPVAVRPSSPSLTNPFPMPEKAGGLASVDCHEVPAVHRTHAAGRPCLRNKSKV
jgi:hypothetical protein